MATSGETGFDPRQHRYGESRWFEDFSVGETFYIPSRTMTDGLFAAFQLASGDNHPIHYDVEYCKARGHKGLLAHGLQVFIQSAAGAGIFPHLVDDSLIAMLGGSFQARGAVYAGDTLYPELEIVEVKPGKTTGVLVMRATVHNQDGELVMEGEHSYLLRKRP